MTESELNVLVGYLEQVVPATIQFFGSMLTLIILVFCVVLVSGFFSFLIRQLYTWFSFRPRQKMV